MGFHGPPRIPGFAYAGGYCYHLVLRTFGHARHFETAQVVADVLLQIRQRASLDGFAVAAYCFMPDHLHLLVEGGTADANLKRFVAEFKRRSGYAFARERKTRLWQGGYYDHVLRSDEDLRTCARYVLANPVRAGIVASPADYPFLGSDLWPIAEIV
jgi:putative transposase